MLSNKLLSLCLSICNDRVCLGLSILQNRILIADDLLIASDLIRSFQAKLFYKFINLISVYNNLCIRQRLVFTAVYKFLNVVNNLFNSAAHCTFSLFLFILFLHLGMQSLNNLRRCEFR